MGSIVGWIGTALIVFGTWKLGQRARYAFLISTAGGLFWVAEGFRIGRVDLVTVNAVLCAIAIVNFRKWGSNER